MRFSAFVLVCFLGPVTATAQDYEREKRWAAEVVPNLVVGDAVRIALGPARNFLGIYTEAKNPGISILLVHGVGVHPDHGVIGILRAALPEMGYATLSIQMPVQKADAAMDDYYPKVFPEAVERIRAGARWLQAKGGSRIVLLSHSMGSWMSNVYYEQTPNPPFAAWICMGLTGGYGGIGNVKVPMLDLYGENDLAAVLRADWRRRLTIALIAGSQQTVIKGADHHYIGREKELATVIREFLQGLH